MKRKFLIFLGMMPCLFLLTGCAETITYSLNLFKPDKATCWPCQMYMAAFRAFSNALESALPVICSNSFKVLTIALAFWLIYKIFPWLVSLSPPNFKDDFIGVLKVLFKAMVIGIFLANPDYFYDQIGDMILQPIGNLFLKISELVLASPNSLGIETSQYAKSENTFLSGVVDFLKNIKNSSGSTLSKASKYLSGSWFDTALSGVSDFFSRFSLPNGTIVEQAKTDRMFGEMPMQIQSVIWQVYSALWTGMGLAFHLIESDYITAFIAGVVLAFALLQMVIALPLSFIDAFIRMGIGILLLPIFMVIWVFPIKVFEGMGKRMVELIFSAFFDILFNCIYVAFLISIINVYVEAKLPPIFSTDFQVSESGMRQAATNLTRDFLIMFVLIYTVLKLSGRVDDITGQFFDGAGKGSNIKKAISNLFKLAGTTAIALGRVAVTGGSDWGGFKNVAKQAGSMAMEGVADMNSTQE